MLGAAELSERSVPHPLAPVAADTSGWLALDTGAGFLALDSRVALRLGVLDSLSSRAVDFAPHTLPRIEIGDLTADQVGPVAVFDAEMLDRVTDRAVLGLVGYRVFRDRILWIDYGSSRLALVPAGADSEMEDPLAVAASRRVLGAALSPAAIPARFQLTMDGKVIVRGRVTPNRGGRATSWLNLVLDTGAAKSTLFEDVVDPSRHLESWRPAISGLIAPNLVASSSARLSRVRQIEIRGTSSIAAAPQTEVALLRNPIAAQLGELAGEPIHGLLGYSFLARFRVACDYPHRVLWLDPIPDFRDPNPYEHSHVGIQLERIAGAVRVASVVQGSPAARAGIQAGDELLAIDSKSLAGRDWSEIGRLIDGPPGSPIDLTFRRRAVEKVYHLRRRQLL